MTRFAAESYERSPGGECFVRETTKPGLLPRILNGLLQARARAKAEMKKETNPFKQVRPSSLSSCGETFGNACVCGSVSPGLLYNARLCSTEGSWL